METRAISHIIACTTATTHNLYTCPQNCRGKVVLVFITNANGNNSVNLTWYRAAKDTNYFILGGKNLSLGEFVQLSDSYIILEPGDRLDITLSTAGNVDAFCTVEESFISNTVRAS